MRHKVNKFPEELQLKIVEEYLTTSLSIKELKSKYGIRSDGNIYNWMRKFGITKPNDEQIKLQNAMSQEKDKTPQERALEEKVENLKQELEHEKLRSLTLNKLIDVAERDLKIDIRKKPGAKQ